METILEKSILERYYVSGAIREKAKAKLKSSAAVPSIRSTKWQRRSDHASLLKRLRGQQENTTAHISTGKAAHGKRYAAAARIRGGLPSGRQLPAGPEADRKRGGHPQQRRCEA